MDGNRQPEVAPAGPGIQVTEVARSLAAVTPAADDDGGAGLIDQLRQLEDLKPAEAALQARIADRHRRDQRHHAKAKKHAAPTTRRRRDSSPP